MDSPCPPVEKKTRCHTGKFLVPAILLLGWAVVAAYGQLERIDGLAKADPTAAAEELVWLTRVVACALGVGTVAIGAWVWWLGHRLRQTGWFPSPEIDVLHPTRIHTSADATDIGRATQVVGLIVMCLGVATSWLLVQLAQMLMQQ